ncbi:precorrin-4 C(11)-methyltransferase [Prochlorococcus sp. MIT 1223]|uniref:precorrin-4 C(11)-methyltransferase n=1 Tax=Prochlorococcus sp. MIT 1223 TaxID=3096217 RepID=UPI002A758238|nr:precorrin-4 C(11)-methyltransferase [Prochlorococcus sp. MIT 1223]
MRKISIVGAGPGALDLITQRALNRIEEAEVLVWTDSLIPPRLLELSQNNCERIPSGSLTLEEILRILIKKAKSGKKVVRLHDGDPCLFGALTEQINLIKQAEIDVEVIPGISAYQATAAALQAELTIPGITQTIILSRASGRTGTPEREKLEKLACLRSSLCLYLSARHVEEVEETLLKYYPHDTPVAIGYRVSWEDEWLTVVPLKQMAAKSKEKGLIRTTIYIISPAFNTKDKRSKLYDKSHNHLFRLN